MPKSYLPNYKEFYDARYFCPADNATSPTPSARRAERPVRHRPAVRLPQRCPAFALGVEICEDLWMPVPPSSLQALDGATVLANLSASNEVIGKAGYRRQLVARSRPGASRATSTPRAATANRPPTSSSAGTA